MQFPPSFLDEIRSRLNISEIVRRKVQLKSHGREHQGLCPFHKEKSPSFTVSDEKGFYHCFGCGAHGDVIKFTVETQNISFADAVKELAAQAGIPLPKIDRQYEERQKKAQSLYEIMEEACKFFQEQLNLPSGNEARSYLSGRKLTRKSTDKFRIGFAPNSRFALKKHLNGMNISDQDMITIGLLTKNESGDVYDKFRNRIIFPIMDIKGRVVAFGGRILGDGMPKYLNSPETPLFKKGEILYNENNARNIAFKTGRLVVAEGYMDVIAMDSVGITTAVAPLGTAVTPSHIKRLWQMAKEPVICLDGDAAGRRAMEKVSHNCLPMLEPGYTLKFTTLIDNMDPDDYIRKAGVEAMRKALQNAKPLSEVLWQTELQRSDISTPERKADLEKRLNDLAGQIKNTSVAKYYNDFFRAMLWEEGKKNNYKISGGSASEGIRHLPDIDIQKLQGCEEMLIIFLLNYPSLLADNEVFEEFSNGNIEFSSNSLDNIRLAIIELCGIVEEITEENLRRHLENSGLTNDISKLGELRKRFISVGKERALAGWKYNILLHHLIILKAECEEAEKRMTEDSEAAVMEMRRQISELNIEKQRMEMAFGD